MDDRMRDRRIDALLGSTMPETLDGASAVCLDAEQIAAWVAGALESEDALAVETHLARCARCQAIAAALANTEPAAETHVPAALPPSGRKTMWWVLPAGVAAAAALVWAIMPARIAEPPTMTVARVERAAEPDMLAPGRAASEQKPAPAPGDAPAAMPPPAAAARIGSAEAAPQDQAADAQDDRAAASSATAAPSGARATSPTPPPSAAAVPPPPAPAPSEAAARLSPPPPPAAPARRESATTEATESQNSQRPAGSTAATAAPSASGMVARDAVSSPSADGAAGAAAAKSVEAARPIALAERPATFEFASNAPAGRIAGRSGNVRQMAAPTETRWRVGGSIVQRSQNAGRSWDVIPVPGSVTLLAGSAPTVNACWLVGRGGVVLRATDGYTFVPRPFPLAVDLVAVSARNALSAIVTTEDGRAFTTSDGGVTWTAP